MKDVFLQLVRLGIGTSKDAKISKDIDWESVEILAKQHRLMGIIYDAVQELKSLSGSSQDILPPLTTWLRWIGEVQLEEARYSQQWNEARKMAQLFHQNGIRTYVLKGNVVAECYPEPEHRVSCDLDCFLINDGSLRQAQGKLSSPQENDNENSSWEKGNLLIEDTGGEVEKVFYKNSTFHLPGLTVENHRFLTPFRGNKTLRRLEVYLQVELKGCSRSSNGLSGSRFEGTELWRPPVMVSALFLIEHAYSHFLHEGLTWRHVLDWVMFSRKHKNEIDWYVLDALIDEFGFRKFYNVFNEIGQDAFGNTYNSTLSTDSKLSTLNSKLKSLMLNDIWAPLDLHESVRGFKGKLALVGNTWCARWKYRYFTNISWFTALWIQVKGFVFEKNPKLD